jgi:hypothetical protein
MSSEERKVSAGLPQEKACKGVSPRGYVREAILLSANRHNRQMRQAWILLRVRTVGFGAGGSAGEQSWSQP